MADKTVPSAPQPTTSPPAPQTPHQHTSHTTSDSETDYNPTPLHSPGGPQYEDLPPSYDFALSDARNGVASLDASQIEAHRVSANEGPDEPEVWEYRMRGENVDEDEETDVREEAPAYEGHVPVQHVARSENVVVGRVQGANAQHDDPPDSVPEVGGSESQRGVPWSPFGAPGNGPFGAPGRGPFGAPGHGPFGAPGNGPFARGQRGRHGPRRSGRGARSSSQAQDWAALGQNMGRWGEEFGRRMGNWGEQFGRQAGAMGEQIGRQAEAMGQQIGREAGARASAFSGSASTAHTTSATASSSVQTAEPPRYDDPPSYQPPTGAAGQETGVMYGDRKTDSYPTEKIPQSPSEKPSAQTLGKGKAADYDNDDDDDSSISSDSTDSSSSDSEEDDDYGDAQAAFLKRMESIQRTAEDSAKKGKRSLEEINHERDLAIAQAVNEKEAAELKHAKWQARRTQKKELRGRKRELKREYRQRKRESREKADGKGKGKGKAKKGSEFKDLKKEYKAKRRALKRERTDAKREWKKTKRETRKERKQGSVGGRPEQKVLNEKASGL